MFLASVPLIAVALAAPADGSSEVTRVFEQEVATVFTEKDGLPSGMVRDVLLGEDRTPLAVAGAGLWRLEEGVWQEADVEEPPAKKALPADIPPAEGRVLSYAASGSSQAIGMTKGLWLRESSSAPWERALPSDERYSWALRDVAAVAYDTKGRLWFGAREGVGVLDEGTWRLFTGAEGLPYNRFTCATPGEGGVMWFGTEKGAIRCDGERFAYRFSRRWLPDDHVNAIAVEPNGTAWIATNRGVGRIEREPMTLEDKAVFFTDMTEKRHVRDGFVADCRLTERFNRESWAPKISDNDGTYTAKYGAAQAFRYAVTKEPEAKAIAKRCFEACKWLMDITGDDGFPARVIIPIDWPEPVNEQYGKAYNERKRLTDPLWKQILPRFVESADGKHLWKCDTSSDELAGHYFFYGVYYDLAAETEEEREAVRETCGKLTDHLIRNGFLLRDHDGLPTRWGNHSPEFVDSVMGWDQRGLNSMMMLSYLNVAYHITGKPEYAEAAAMLREKHHYHINAMHPREFFPPDNVVPWDNNLALCSFYGLMNYEEDPELLLMYRMSLENAWLLISKQKNALWNVIYGAAAKRFAEVVDTGVYGKGEVFPDIGPFAQHTANTFAKSDPRMGDVLESLCGMPLDLIGYRMDNAHRLDVVFDPTPGQGPDVGWHYDGRALPLEERGHVRQDRDGFALNACEDDGWGEHEGTFFVLPYYMARYHGLIE